MNKVSIIIPVYNTEKYIIKCLTSLLNQTYKNIEIVIVNDGSTDSSEQIIKNFIKTYKNSNIEYFYQKNSKQGAARNFGLNKATGDYIMFVDSDDYLPSDSIERLFKGIGTTEIAIGNMMKDENGIISHVHYIDKVLRKAKRKGIINLKNIRDSIHLTSPCNKLYKKELLFNNHIFFTENMIWEDGPFFIKIWMIVSSISFIDEVVYVRSVRTSEINKSTTQELNETVITDDIKSYNLSFEECIKFNEYSFIPEMLFHFYRNNIKRIGQMELKDGNKKRELIDKVDEHFNKWEAYLKEINGKYFKIYILKFIKKLVKLKYLKTI